MLYSNNIDVCAVKDGWMPVHFMIAQLAVADDPITRNPRHFMGGGGSGGSTSSFLIGSHKTNTHSPKCFYSIATITLLRPLCVVVFLFILLQNHFIARSSRVDSFRECLRGLLKTNRMDWRQINYCPHFIHFSSSGLFYVAAAAAADAESKGGWGPWSD